MSEKNSGVFVNLVKKAVGLPNGSSSCCGSTTAASESSCCSTAPAKAEAASSCGTDKPESAGGCCGTDATSGSCCG
jgi:hypothetical protein